MMVAGSFSTEVPAEERLSRLLPGDLLPSLPGKNLLSRRLAAWAIGKISQMGAVASPSLAPFPGQTADPGPALCDPPGPVAEEIAVSPL